MAVKEKHLVTGHLERVSSKLFSDYSSELTAHVGKQHGIYALYKGNRLYYVGLATNLKSRVKQHLKDKHSARWDKFSVYLVRKVDHIKELESLILRVVDPRGNTKMGILHGSKNLKVRLIEEIKRTQVEQLAKLMGKVPKDRTTPRRKPRKAKPEHGQKDKRKKPALAPYVDRQFTIKHVYKGEMYKATVKKTGWIIMEGKKYSTPTAAALDIVSRPTVNGWSFWLFKEADGEWGSINKLRK